MESVAPLLREGHLQLPVHLRWRHDRSWRRRRPLLLPLLWKLLLAGLLSLELLLELVLLLLQYFLAEARRADVSGAIVILGVVVPCSIHGHGRRVMLSGRRERRRRRWARRCDVALRSSLGAAVAGAPLAPVGSSRRRRRRPLRVAVAAVVAAAAAAATAALEGSVSCTALPLQTAAAAEAAPALPSSLQ